jgi:hypothetical protein
MNLKNKRNEYALAGGADLFDQCPKTVWAAIAVSLVTAGGQYLDEARALILDEWQILHAAGIVPQKPPGFDQ